VKNTKTSATNDIYEIIDFAGGDWWLLLLPKIILSTLIWRKLS